MGSTAFKNRSKKTVKTLAAARNEFERIRSENFSMGTTGTIGDKNMIQFIAHQYRTDKEVLKDVERFLDEEIQNILPDDDKFDAGDKWDLTCGAIWLPESKQWLFFGHAAN